MDLGPSIKHAYVELSNNNDLKKLKEFSTIFNGYGFLYCYNINRYSELIDIYGNSIIEITEGIIQIVSNYANRENFFEQDKDIDKILGGTSFESLIWKRGYIYFLKKKLEEVTDDTLRSPIIQNIRKYSKEEDLTDNFDLSQLLNYIYRTNAKYTDSSIDNYIKKNKDIILLSLKPILEEKKKASNDNYNEITNRLKIEINRIEKL